MGEPSRFSATDLEAQHGHVYTPSGTGPLERVVKLLNRYYPRRTVAECREVLALMYGHESWQLLETAAICGESSADDEDEAAERVHARRERQVRIAREHLAGATEEAASAAARMEKELGAAGGLSISRRHDPHWRRQRVERARYAYEVAYAQHAIEEISPSAGQRPAIPPDDQGLHLSVRVELLPRTLVIWLYHQRPRLSGLADRVAALRVRQHSQCDLLKLAFAWGEACVSHPTDIPDALQIYPLALCAKWYGWNACGVATPMAGALEPRASQPKGQVLALALDPTLDAQQRLLRAQPREDVAALSVPVRDRQLSAGYALVRQYMQDAAAAQPMHRFMSKPPRGADAAVARQATN